MTRERDDEDIDISRKTRISVSYQHTGQMNTTSADVSRSRSAQAYDSPLRGRDTDLSLAAYSFAELQVLQEIISTSANATDGTSFLSLFKAYDIVLKARDIDPAKDRVYFKFLLKLARVQGATWTDKYNNILKGQNTDTRQLPYSHHTPQPSYSPQQHHRQQRPHILPPARTLSDVGVPRTVHDLAAYPRPQSVVETRSNRHDISIRQHRDPEFTISFDDDPRKYSILRQYWHAWRAKSIRRRSRIASLVQVADLHYRHILLPITFETWKQKWRYFAVLHRRVERDRIRTILARCLDWWRYSTLQLTKRSDRIHNEVALRRTFNAWLRHIQINQQRQASLTLSNVMERWKAKASTTRDLNATAENWRRQRLLRQFWKEWFFRTCSVKTVQYYNIKLKQRALGRWLFKMRRLHEMNRRAVYVARRNVALTALTKWAVASHTASEQAERAERHRRHRLLFTSLRIWERNQQLSLRAGLLADRIDNRLIRDAWIRWRDVTKMTIDAGTKANCNLLRNSFKAWRDDAMVSKLDRQIDRRIITESFSYWMVRQRGRLLERVRDHRFLQEALEIWRDRFDGIREELDTTFEILEHARIAKVLKSSLQLWRENLEFRNEEHELALVCHETSLQRKSLKFWRSSLETHQRLKKEAEHAHYYFLARRSLMRWHAKSIQVRKQKRQQLLSEYQSRKGLELVAQCFTYWREKTSHHLERSQLAEAVRHEKDLDLVHEILTHWRDRLDVLAELKVKGIEHSRTQLLRTCFNGWTVSLSRVDELSEALDDYLVLRDENALSQHLRAWRMRLFQLNGPSMQADLFNQRSRRLKMRLVLRIWKEKVAARKNIDDSLSSSVLEDSIRAHTAPITPRKSTRRHLWRNINSR